MTQSPVVLVTMKGIDDKGQKSIISVLNVLKLEGVNYQLNLGGIRDAHLVIVDAHEECGQHALQEVNDSQVKLVISNQHPSGKNLIAVQKPLSDTLLKQVLTRLFFTMIGYIDKELCRKSA